MFIRNFLCLQELLELQREKAALDAKVAVVKARQAKVDATRKVMYACGLSITSLLFGILCTLFDRNMHKVSSDYVQTYVAIYSLSDSTVNDTNATQDEEAAHAFLCNVQSIAAGGVREKASKRKSETADCIAPRLTGMFRNFLYFYTNAQVFFSPLHVLRRVPYTDFNFSHLHYRSHRAR